MDNSNSNGAAAAAGGSMSAFQPPTAEMAAMHAIMESCPAKAVISTVIGKIRKELNLTFIIGHFHLFLFFFVLITFLYDISHLLNFVSN